MSDNDNGASGLGWFLAGLGRRRAGWRAVCAEVRQRDAGRYGSAREEAKERAAMAQQGRENARSQYAEQGKQQVNEYVDRGKEYYDSGRTQWSQYVDKGKSLVQEHQDKVSAAIDAGKEAYVSTTSERTIGLRRAIAEFET